MSLPGFSILRNDRSGKQGGGVALYICDALRGKILASSPSDYSANPEYLVAEVKSSSIPPFLLAVIYRPPKTPNLASFAADFDLFTGDYSFSVVLGDLNANQLTDSYEAENVRSFCRSRSLYMVPYAPTHHSSTADSILDLCLVSDRDAVINHGQSDTPFIAGHDLIFVSIALSAPVATRPITARSYRNFSVDAFVTSLDAMNWDCFSSPVSADELLSRLETNLTAALDSQAPSRTFIPKRGVPPWITPELQAQVRMRDTLYRRYKRTRSRSDLLSYRCTRDSVHKRISVTRSAFYADRLANAAGPRALWNELRSLGLAATQRSDCAGFSADALNAHFAAVSRRPDATAEIADFFTALPPPRYDDAFFYLADISPTALVEAISHFASQSRGADGLSLRNVKDALPVIFPYLLLLFNQSLSSGVFPSSWKRARILPLAKVKSPTSLQQMRPIANLPLLSKVLERIVLIQLMSFLESRSLLDSRQSGFRWGRNTQTALLKLADDVRLGIDKRLVTIVVLFDFSKAFDTIPHSIILAKLLALGLSQHALTWMASYLQGRSQAVVDSTGKLSSWLPLDQGVPQGSVLGPLLFVAFINDISTIFRHSEHLLYADDLQIYLQCPVADLSEAVRKLNEDVVAVQAWSSKNSLRLNPSKTQAIILGSSPFLTRLSPADCPPVVLNGVNIPFSHTVRNLGLIIDSSLSWVPQIDALSSRVHCALRQLSASRSMLSPALRNYLSTALIMPLFDYCCIVYSDIPGALNTRLQRLQNCCVRFIIGIARDEHVTATRRELGWLSARDRRLFLLGTLLFTIIRSNSPDYLRALFVDRTASTSLGPSRRAMGDFVIPRFATEAYRRSFAVSGAYFWESLPPEVRGCLTLPAFRVQLRSYLFRTESNR